MRFVLVPGQPGPARQAPPHVTLSQIISSGSDEDFRAVCEEGWACSGRSAGGGRNAATLRVPDTDSTGPKTSVCNGFKAGEESDSWHWIQWVGVHTADFLQDIRTSEEEHAIRQAIQFGGFWSKCMSFFHHTHRPIYTYVIFQMTKREIKITKQKTKKPLGARVFSCVCFFRAFALWCMFEHCGSWLLYFLSYPEYS